MNRIDFVKSHKDELSHKKSLFLDLKKYEEIYKISSPDDTASRSYVYIARDEDGNGVVLKITKIDEYDYHKLEYTYPVMEAKIYNVTNKLIENKITPHIFMLMDSMKPTFIDKKHDFYNIIDQEVYVSAMLLETFHKKDELFELNELIRYNPATEKTIFNLLFQIIYTLEAFNMIGLKHNDLHLSNIMVIKKTLATKNQCIEYILADGTTVRLPYIGYDTRIYDFDRSCKLKRGKYSEEIRMPDDSFRQFYQTCIPNDKFDTYKILGHVHKHTKLKGIHKFIESCFPSKELIKKGTLKGRTYNNTFDGKRHYQIKWKPKDKHMLSTSVILSRLAEKVHDKSCNNVIDTYSLKNIGPPIYIPKRSKGTLKSKVLRRIPTALRSKGTLKSKILSRIPSALRSRRRRSKRRSTTNA